MVYEILHDHHLQSNRLVTMPNKLLNFSLGCCKHIIVSFGSKARKHYEDYEGFYSMEKPAMIGDKQKWKKHRLHSTNPDYFLTTLAPEDVDVWLFSQDTNGLEPDVKSKSVSGVTELKHCPTDYPVNEWVYRSTKSNPIKPWKQASVKIVCAPEATSMC